MAVRYSSPIAFNRLTASPATPMCFCTVSVAASEVRLFVRLPKNRCADAFCEINATTTSAQPHRMIEFVVMTYILVAFAAPTTAKAKLRYVKIAALQLIQSLFLLRGKQFHGLGRAFVAQFGHCRLIKSTAGEQVALLLGELGSQRVQFLFLIVSELQLSSGLAGGQSAGANIPQVRLKLNLTQPLVLIGRNDRFELGIELVIQAVANFGHLLTLLGGQVLEVLRINACRLIFLLSRGIHVVAQRSELARDVAAHAQVLLHSLTTHDDHWAERTTKPSKPESAAAFAFLLAKSDTHDQRRCNRRHTQGSNGPLHCWLLMEKVNEYRPPMTSESEPPTSRQPWTV